MYLMASAWPTSCSSRARSGSFLASSSTVGRRFRSVAESTELDPVLPPLLSPSDSELERSPSLVLSCFARTESSESPGSFGRPPFAGGDRGATGSARLAAACLSDSTSSESVSMVFLASSKSDIASSRCCCALHAVSAASDGGVKPLGYCSSLRTLGGRVHRRDRLLPLSQRRLQRLIQTSQGRLPFLGCRARRSALRGFGLRDGGGPLLLENFAVSLELVPLGPQPGNLLLGALVPLLTETGAIAAAPRSRASVLSERLRDDRALVLDIALRT